MAGLVAPGAAMAQGSSSCQAYNPQLCENITVPSTSHTTATGTESLPFTGLDVGLLAVGGIGLAGAGIAVRRLSHENE